LNPDDAGDAAVDSDGDGQVNRAEFLAGTDPQNGGSRFMVHSISRAAGRVSLSWSSVPGKVYQIEISDNLADWELANADDGFPLQVSAASGSETFVELSQSAAVGGLKKFFRVSVVP
jgi:hypothetical protein